MHILVAMHRMQNAEMTNHNMFVFVTRVSASAHFVQRVVWRLCDLTRLTLTHHWPYTLDTYVCLLRVYVRKFLQRIKHHLNSFFTVKTLFLAKFGYSFCVKCSKTYTCLVTMCVRPRVHRFHIISEPPKLNQSLYAIAVFFSSRFCFI